MTGKPSNDSYSEEETRRRVERALRAAFNTPPKPQSEMKLGKPRGKPRKSPAKRKAGKPGRCESCVLSFALARARSSTAVPVPRPLPNANASC